MITLPDLKDWLEVEGDEADDLLTSLEARAVEFVERETGRYFGALENVTEILCGDGGGKLRLAEVPTSIPASVQERAYVGADATTITASDDDGYELRTLTLPSSNLAYLLRKGGCVWARGFEYSVTYERGYAAGDEPGDIRQLVLDLVQVKWAMRDAGGGVFRSESLGPYSYTLADLSRLPGYRAEDAQATIQRWRGWIV